ncbi:CheW-like domain protein [compost metagenome]
MSAGDRLNELRAAFDAQFADAPAAEAEPGEALVGIRVGGEHAAFRLSELAGLQPTPRLMWVPGGPPAWRGLAGIRGKLVPVYDLAALIGLEPASEAASWLALGRGEPACAFAFQAIEGLLQLPPHAIGPAADHLAMPEIATHGGRVIGVLRTAALIDLVHPPSGLAAVAKENPS